MKTEKIYINGYIGSDSFFGEASFSLADLNQKLDNLSSATELDVYINSGGGSVTEGFAIYDRLMAFDGIVNTYVNGMCGSIATVIYQAGKKGKRFMFENSEFFVHNPFWQPTAPDPMEAKDLAQLHEDLKAAENKIKSFYATITGKGIEELTPLLDRQTTLSAEEAINNGFADEVVSTQIKAFTKYKIAAYLNNNKKTEMAENTEIKNELSGLKNMFARLSKKLFKNAMAETAEGVVVYFDGEAVEVGTALFIDEAMSEPAPNGQHTVGDNVFVVADGVVTEILPIEDVEALKSEIETLKAALAEKDAIVNEKETVINETKVELQAFAGKVKEFEAMLVTGQNFKADGSQNSGRKTTETVAPQTPLERFAAWKKEQNK